MTSSWLIVHTELRCTVNHKSDFKKVLVHTTDELGTDRVFRNVGKLNSEVGDHPKKEKNIHNTAKV